jgi:hypothetical protein
MCLKTRTARMLAATPALLSSLSSLALFGVTSSLTPATGQAADVVTVKAAPADACHTWFRPLRQDMSGPDIYQLQIRVAGWATYRDIVLIDGKYGPKTAAAVGRVHAGYRLLAMCIVDRRPFAIHTLQDNDCTLGALARLAEALRTGTADG